MISVVVCNHNYGQFLDQAIQSVLDQTHSDFELVIVDDGSSDSSRDVLTGLRDPRIQLIFQEHAGQAVAMNRGFARVRGEIVCLLDSDDWWRKDKLAEVLRWHQFINGQYSVLQHGLDIWQEGNLSAYKLILPVGNCAQEMKVTGRIDYFMPTSGLVFPRTILQKIGSIPEIFVTCADAFLTRAAFIHGQVVSLPNSLGFYRAHQNYVYRNPAFSLESFFHKKLFPELNKYYEDNNFEHRFSCKKKDPLHFLSSFFKSRIKHEPNR